MSHVVSPVSYRNGKTFLWFSNINVLNQQKVINTGHNLLLSAGLSKIIKKILKKKRCYLVKNSIQNFLINNKIFCKVLFMPRIKRRPKSDSLGNFAKHIFYKPINFNKKWLQTYINYADQRQLKNFLFFSQRNKSLNLNKWIANRMMRGSVRKARIPWIKINFKRINNLIYKLQKKNKYYLIKRYICIKNKANSVFIKKVLNEKKKNQWFLDLWKQKRIIIHNTLISLNVNKMTGLNTKIYCLNIWEYLLKKKILNFKNYQRQLWYPFLKNLRFWYKNYFDIVNSFFILSFITNTEHLLFDTLKMVLPRLDKNRKDLRKFIYNLDKIIKKLPFIQNAFTCFRLNLIGKYQGGSKRTNQIKIGFGRLVNNSLLKNDKKVSTEFTHRFGAFGVDLLTQRRFFKNSQIELTPAIKYVNINK